MLRKNQLIEVPDDSPFANDKLKRNKAVETAAALITNAQTPFVLSVTGAWGTGKTTFVKMLEAVLRKQGHLCIHHNAWQNDFADDPLVGLVEEIQATIRSSVLSPAAKKTVGTQLRKVQAKTKGLLRAIGPLALQVATRGALKGDDAKRYAEILATSADQIATAVSNYSDESLRRHQKARESTLGLRLQLAELVATISTSGAVTNTPVVFVIDELDRCRPTFAIQLLERVKHIFDVAGLVFVLALDRDQLCHSIQAVYGSEFDAAGYLRRFVDLGYSLRTPSLEDFVYSIWDTLGLDDACKAASTVQGGKVSFVQEFCPIAKIFGTSLRDVEQALSQLNVIVSLATREKWIELTEFAVICALRMAIPLPFQAFVDGRKSAEDLIAEVRARPLGRTWLEDDASLRFEAMLNVWSRVPGELEKQRESLQALRESVPPERPERRRGVRLLGWIDRLRDGSGGAIDLLAHHVSLFELADGFSSVS